MTFSTFFKGATLFLASSLSAVAQPDATDMDKGRLRIGLIFPFSGPQAPYGDEALAGAEVAIDRLRVSSPELAQRIELIKGDDQNRPSETTRIADDLLTKRQVSILIGALTPATTLAAAKVAQHRERPLIIPAVTDPGASKLGEYIFRTSVTDTDQGKSLAQFSLSELACKKAALLVGRQAYSQELAGGFETAFATGGGTIAARETYEPGTKSFKTPLKALADSSPDVIMIPALATESVQILKDMIALGIKIPVVGGDSWENDAVAAILAKKLGPKLFHTSPFSAEAPGPDVVDFLERFKAKVRRFPSPLAALAYDATMAAAEAYRNARGPQSTGLQKALMGLNNVPITVGTLSMAPERSANKTAIIMEYSKSGTHFRSIVPVGNTSPITASPKAPEAG